MNASRQARRIDPLGCAVPTITRISSERIRYLCAAGVNAQQTVSPGQTQYLHGDLIDSTMLTTDQWGTGSQPVISYTAFGEPIGDPDLLGTRYQYAGGWGYESDLLASDGAPDCGLPPIVLLHVGARWYDPSLGRFLQRDPIGLAGGTNVYVYVRSAPGASADPSGLLSVMPGGKPPDWPGDGWDPYGLVSDAAMEVAGGLGDWAGDAAGGAGTGAVCVFWTVTGGLDVVGNIGPIIGYVWARDAAIGGDWDEYERRRRMVVYSGFDFAGTRWRP